jgi:hypothetical protein
MNNFRCYKELVDDIAMAYEIEDQEVWQNIYDCFLKKLLDCKEKNCRNIKEKLQFLTNENKGDLLKKLFTNTNSDELAKIEEILEICFMEKYDVNEYILEGYEILYKK